MELCPAGERELVIYGAGDQGLVAAEAAMLVGCLVVGFRDDHRPAGEMVGRWRVLGEGEARRMPTLVAIGDNAARDRVAQRLIEQGVELRILTHPNGWTSPSAYLAEGVFIGPRAVVHTEARVGQAAIINSGAIVEHHVRVGRAAHVAPGAVLAGRVTVGDRTLIGAAAVVRPRITIGNDAIIGAGAVVVRDVPDNTTVVGNPARPLS